MSFSLRGQAGASVSWTVTVPEDGPYTFFISYGNAGQDANLTLGINGTPRKDAVNLKNYGHYTVWAKARLTAIHQAMIDLRGESPYDKDWLDRPGHDHRITTRLDVGSFLWARSGALRAHATQVDPEGFWFRIPLELQQKVWPTEDFELARSLVDSPVPESDLFAGIREKVDTH